MGQHQERGRRGETDRIGPPKTTLEPSPETVKGEDPDDEILAELAIIQTALLFHRQERITLSNPPGEEAGCLAVVGMTLCGI